MTVWVLSFHVMSEIPFVVPLAHEPFPVGMGSWYFAPLAVMTCPADTTPDVGAPDWLGSELQLSRVPPKLYLKFTGVEPVRPGLKLAVPCSTHPPPPGAAWLCGATIHSAATASSAGPNAILPVMGSSF